MSASRKAGYYWVKYVSQDHWSIEYWNGGMWFTRNPHIVEDSMFSTIDETPIVREQKQVKQQGNCNLTQVINRRELLLAFIDYMQEEIGVWSKSKHTEEIVDGFIASNSL